MTTLQEAPVTSRPPTHHHIRKFWAATVITLLAVLGISAVVAATAGARVGKLVLVSALLVSSASALSDAFVAWKRRNRQRR